LPYRESQDQVSHKINWNDKSSSYIGKTTLAATVVNRLNARNNGPHDIAAFVPMDGYHLSRAQLSALPNPIEAHARRGAEFTFDGRSFLALVRAVRSQSPSSSILYAPSFDHAIKDPKENDIPILPTTRVVIFEGLYLNLEKNPWKEAAGLMDELWFVDVDFEVARRRVVERHVRTGVTATREEAERRVAENDLVNGEEIVRCRIKDIDEIISSREDDTWKPVAQGE
jgi:pantothenate kinase